MMKFSKYLSIFMALVMLAALRVPAFAAVEDTGFSDVSATAWYAEAVEYCKDNGIMSGTSATTFAPDEAMSRAMMATVLYRAAGSPAATGVNQFSDVSDGTWYTSGVIWAAENGIVSGYGNGLFGTNDPITREQAAVILWRYEGSPLADDSSAKPADATSVSDWAVSAVTWALQNDVFRARSGNIFDPKTSATRAELAYAFMNCLSATAAPVADKAESNILIAYFSRTGATEQVADVIHDIVGGDMVEIKTVTPYPESYDEVLAQAQREQAENYRPELPTTVSSMDDYDIIFVGYPIWYGTCPMAVFSFLESYDLSGKTIVPFCTSGSTGISRSAREIGETCAGSTVLEGLGLSGSSASNPRSAVAAWLERLNIPKKNTDAVGSNSSQSTRVRLSFNSHEVIVTMYDNPASKDFLSMLPLTLTFEDYNNTEKISYLPRNLTTEGAPTAIDPVAGDFTYYATWGNLAIFYKDHKSSNNSLKSLGHIDSGIELLAAMNGEVEVIIEKVD